MRFLYQKNNNPFKCCKYIDTVIKKMHRIDFEAIEHNMPKILQRLNNVSRQNIIPFTIQLQNDMDKRE